MSNPLKRKADNVAADYKSYKRRLSSGGVATTSPSWLHTRSAISCPPDLAIDKLRQTMLAEMQERVSEVDWDYFMEYLLPPLHKRIKMDDVMKKLAKSKHVVKRNGQLRWAAFADGSPSTKQLPEDKVFEVMEDIASATGLSAKHKGRRSTQIALEPTITPISDTRDNSGKPDGYFVFNHVGSSLKDETPRWCDIAVPAEFKKDDDKKAANDNATQLLWSLNHIMREDARRRFAFGFTIEDAHLRIWFVSRSHILASFAIDFTTEMERVAEFFLRIMWADVHDLGIDHTIQPTGAKDATGGVQYDIEVNGKKYRTQRLISSIGAEWIRGRGTRVWEVRELDKKGNEFGPCLVLKDAWVDHGRLREPEVLRQVRASARNQEDADIFDRHLLHVAHSGDVLTRDDEPDDTLSIICRGGVPASETYLTIKKDLKDDATVKIKNPPKRALATEYAPQQRLVAYPRRVHHRTVFEEVGITILEVKKLQHAFWALKDVITVLGVMHACGWVHRDVSAGNVLIHDNYGKLADLEFAKRATDTTTHDVRTGTEYFMAVEVKDGRYIYSFINRETGHGGNLAAVEDESSHVAEDDRGVPVAKRPRLGALDSDSEDEEPDETCSESSDRISAADSLPVPAMCSAMPPSLIPFRHNPLHDLESVLWLSWYLLASTKLPQFEHLQECEWGTFLFNRSNLSAQLFNNDKFRLEMMSPENSSLYTEIAKLHPVLEAIFRQLDPLRVALGKAYRDAEFTIQQKAIDWMAKHQAARAQGEAGPEDQPPAIPFSVAWDKNLYATFRQVLDKIVSERKPRYLYLNGKPIRFQPRTTLLAEQIREMENLQEQVKAERLARLAALAASRSNGELPETPKAPRTLKRSMRG